MNLYRITYTVTSPEHKLSGEHFVRAETMDDKQAAREVVALWALTSEHEAAMLETLLEEGYAEIRGTHRLDIEDLCWQEVKAVTVVVQGGVIQEVSDIPAGVRVKVVDWDDDCSDGSGEPTPSVRFWG